MQEQCPAKSFIRHNARVAVAARLILRSTPFSQRPTLDFLRVDVDHNTGAVDGVIGVEGDVVESRMILHLQRPILEPIDQVGGC